eukprot:gene20748-7663_t
MLKDGGLLILGVPTGKDCLLFNQQRTYGKIRLKMLVKGWRILSTSGFDKKTFTKSCGTQNQPVIILQKNIT